MGDLSKHFNRSEFACPDGCGFDTVDAELLQRLEEFREDFGVAIHINSAARCEKHNKEVGGSPKSQHLFAKAVDFWVETVDADTIAEYLLNRFPDKYGIGRYIGRTHFDVRNGKGRWDKRGEG